MMVWSINLLVLAVGILLVGMVKPHWILFWLEKPTRMPIVLFSSALFMGGIIMFGEASLEKETMQKAQTEQKIEKMVESAVPTITVEKVKVDELSVNQ